MRPSLLFATAALQWLSHIAIATATPAISYVGQSIILYDFSTSSLAVFPWTLRTATFTATSNQTILQFLTRNDYNDWYFDDVSVNITGTSTNLVSNGILRLCFTTASVAAAPLDCSCLIHTPQSSTAKQDSPN